MKERPVIFSPEAENDLIGVYDWVADAASPTIAIGYIERVEAFCLRLGIGSHRGHLRSDIRPGLRILGFERRLTIAFVIGMRRSTILRVFAAGRNWEATFSS